MKALEKRIDHMDKNIKGKFDNICSNLNQYEKFGGGILDFEPFEMLYLSGFIVNSA